MDALAGAMPDLSWVGLWTDTPAPCTTGARNGHVPLINQPTSWLTTDTLTGAMPYLFASDTANNPCAEQAMRIKGSIADHQRTETANPATPSDPIVMPTQFTDAWSVLQERHLTGDGFSFPNPQPNAELPPARADRILSRGPLHATAAALVGCGTVQPDAIGPKHSGNGFDSDGRMYLSDHRALVVDYSTASGVASAGVGNRW